MSDTDTIAEISIVPDGRLCIKPTKEKFTLVYRTATEVHWDDKGNFLYSPKPREWSYFDWYKHIVTVILTEGNCKLLLTSQTIWKSIPEELQNSIKDYEGLTS